MLHVRSPLRADWSVGGVGVVKSVCVGRPSRIDHEYPFRAQVHELYSQTVIVREYPKGINKPAVLHVRSPLEADWSVGGVGVVKSVRGGRPSRIDYEYPFRAQVHELYS